MIENMSEQDAQDITQIMGAGQGLPNIPIKTNTGKTPSLLWVVLGCVVVGVGLGVVVYQRSLAPPPLPPTPSTMPIASPQAPTVNAVDKTMSSNVITFPQAGTVRILYDQLKPGTIVPTIPTLITLTSQTGSVSVTTPASAGATPMAILDTGLKVVAGDQVTVRAYTQNNTAQPAMGWVSPNADNTCGKNGFALLSIANALAWAQTAQGSLPLVTQMCWSEYNPTPDKDTSAWAFNHFFVILTYVPTGATVSPTPSPTPSPSPSPSPSPTPSPTTTASPTMSPSPTPSPTVTPTPTPTSGGTTTSTGTSRVAMPSAGSALPVAGVFEVTEGTIGAGILLIFLGALGLLLL